MNYKIDNYKLLGILLGGASGYYVGHKKQYGAYEKLLLIMFAASFGVMLTDIIDGFRNKNRDRLKEMVTRKKGSFTEMFTKGFIPFLIGGVIIYFLTRKDIRNPKQYVLLAIFYVVFAFMVKETVKKKADDENPTESDFEEEKKKGFSLFGNIMDVQFSLFFMMLGMLIVFNRPNPSAMKYIIASLFGVGGGLVMSNLLQGRIDLDGLSDIMKKDRTLMQKRAHSNIVLLNIGKTLDGSKEPTSENVERFVNGLNERELIVMDKIYQTVRDDIDFGKKLKYDDIVAKMKKSEYEQHDIDTFLQIANSYVKYATGDYLPDSALGSTKQYRLTQEVQEYTLDEKGYLKRTGETFKDDTINGRERWLWVKTIMDGKTMKKQIRVVEVGRNRFVLYVGVERI